MISRRPAPRATVPMDTFFDGRSAARRLFHAVRSAAEAAGTCSVRVTRSQVAFRRRRAFAWAWIPGKWLHGDVALLVLTVALRRHDRSPRWKQVVEPAPGRFTHHLELRSSTEVDDEVRAWLAEAWADAG